MPNKYSHAVVLSNYGSHGLIDYDSSRASRPVFSLSSSRSSSGSAKSKSLSSTSTRQCSQHGRPERLRLGSPSRSTTRSISRPVPPPLHRKSSSIETQIYAPLHSPTTPLTRDAHPVRTNGHKSDHKTLSQGISQHDDISLSNEQAYASHGRNAPPCSPSSPLTQGHREAVNVKPQEPTYQPSLRSQPKAEGRKRSSTEVRDFVPQHLPPIEQRLSWRHNSAVAMGGQARASSDTIRASAIRRENDSHRSKGFGQPLRIPHDRHGRVPIAPQPFAPERPPSPPATPESEKSFSLKSPIEKPDPITSPPPIPERSARRSPPGPLPKPNSPTSSMMKVRVEPLGQKTYSARSSPESPTSTDFSITTRTSSLHADTASTSNNRISSMPSEPCFDDDAELNPLPRTFDQPSRPFAVDDADLESLPSTYVPSSPDLNVQPWSDDNAGPAIFRDGELNLQRPSTAGTVSTQASWSDSAAPPPISMNRHLPVLNEVTLPNTPKAPESYEKSRPSLASLAFFRSGPKAILYSQTRAGTPPVPVMVSGTAIPSIPALFPSYKGQFPPSGKAAERSSRASRDLNRLKQMRGRSVPPKASERRKSWFKADLLERPFGLCQQANESELDQIFKNI